VSGDRSSDDAAEKAIRIHPAIVAYGLR
jgi:hypothetical protein